MAKKTEPKLVMMTVDAALEAWCDREGVIPRLRAGQVIQGIEEDGKVQPMCTFMKTKN